MKPVYLCCLVAIGCGDSDDGPDRDAAPPGDDAGAGDDAAAGDDGGGAGCVGMDVDQDGSCGAADCDDENGAIHPGQVEECGNGLDDDCDREADEDCLAGTRAYFVDRDSIGGLCADENPGTETEPWCTIAKANATLIAGDTVYLRAGTYAGETIAPAGSGSSDAERIVYAAYAGETVTLTGSVYCIQLENTAYVSVLGLHFLDCERNLYISASSHSNVGYCVFDNPAGPATWAGSWIHDGSQYNRIYRSTFSRYGEEAFYDGGYEDFGAVLDIGNDYEEDASDYNLVVDNTFFYGGHHILGVYADHNVVRANTFHNEEWFACNRAEIGGLCGGRNLILNASFPDANTHNVIERNAIAFSGVPPDQTNSSGLALRTQYNIVRRNVFYENDSAGISLTADAGNSNDASNNFVYANVLYRNGYPLLDDWDPTKSGMILARWVDDAEHNAMTGVAIKNNILHANQVHGIYYYYVDESDQVLAGNWNEEGDPGFVDVSGTADPFDFGVFDFHLRPESPCVDAGAFLTVTTNEGSASTVLEVENAGYFSDGAGLVGADMIQLEGQSQPVTITALDAEARTIGIDTPLDWAAGTGVSLAYSGAAPDEGAYERDAE